MHFRKMDSVDDCHGAGEHVAKLIMRGADVDRGQRNEVRKVPICLTYWGQVPKDSKLELK